MPDTTQTPRDVVDRYYDFVRFCNTDSAYANDHSASLLRTELDAQWDKECPGLQYPTVTWKSEDCKYHLENISTPRERDRGDTQR